MALNHPGQNILPHKRSFTVLLGITTDEKFPAFYPHEPMQDIPFAL
jgi:hypothetical protein